MGINNKPTFVFMILVGCIAGIMLAGILLPIQIAYTQRTYIKRVQQYKKNQKEHKEAVRAVVRSQFQYIVKDRLPEMANIFVFRGVTYLIKL